MESAGNKTCYDDALPFNRYAVRPMFYRQIAGTIQHDVSLDLVALKAHPVFDYVTSNTKLKRQIINKLFCNTL